MRVHRGYAPRVLYISAGARNERAKAERCLAVGMEEYSQTRFGQLGHSTRYLEKY